MKIRTVLVGAAILLQSSVALSDWLKPAAYEAEPDTAYKYPVHGNLKIDGPMMGICMVQETKKRSHYSLQKRRAVSWCKPPDSSSTFIDYLSARYGNDGSYRQGICMASELYWNFDGDELRKWVIEQPDNSIDPVKIYARALELSAGNVWEAVFLCHDLLRNQARYYHLGRYRCHNEDHYCMEHEVSQFFDKFIDIRGDLKELGGKALGEHRGNWYRLFGTMLYQVNEEEEQDSRDVERHRQGRNCPRHRSVLSKGLEEFRTIIDMSFSTVEGSLGVLYQEEEKVRHNVGIWAVNHDLLSVTEGERQSGALIPQDLGKIQVGIQGYYAGWLIRNRLFNHSVYGTSMPTEEYCKNRGYLSR